MTEKPAIAILFADARAAECNVAGIPAAARALHHCAASMEGGKRCLVLVPSGWMPSAWVRDEIARLAPVLEWDTCSETAADGWIGGEDAQFAAQCQPVADRALAAPATVAGLRGCARRIVVETGKASDGIVSRFLNRPVSQAITRLVLRWPGARPGHATFAAGLLGVAMFAALILGGQAGLMAGAVLFQLASIVDGVDGEIARATFRSSRRGAMLDTLTDAATNLGFIGGVSYNLLLAGNGRAAAAGAIGFGAIATGNLLLGSIARRDKSGFSFDTLKVHLRERPSPFRQALIWIGSRDFYALAACLAVLAGGAAFALYAFAGAATIWLALLCRTLLRRASAHG